MVRPKPVASVSAGLLALYPLSASFTSLPLAMDAVLTAEEMLAIAQEACTAKPLENAGCKDQVFMEGQSTSMEGL